ncbi:MAG: hypothetical protein AAB432_01880 [Patescibacteria group bacterium]
MDQTKKEKLTEKILLILNVIYERVFLVKQRNIENKFKDLENKIDQRNKK